MFMAEYYLSFFKSINLYAKAIVIIFCMCVCVFFVSVFGFCLCFVCICDIALYIYIILSVKTEQNFEQYFSLDANKSMILLLCR